MKKVVLITGCSSGIGFLTALKFAREGNKVYASVKTLADKGCEDLKKISQEEHLPLEVIEIDITDDISIKKGTTSIQKEEGKIDILINNAGFGYMGPVETFSLDEVRNQYETNIFGTFQMIKAVTPIMRSQKSGLIINISSINGLVSFPFYGIYSSSKYALESLTESLRFELSPFGIHVALVEPGTFLTNFTANRKFPKNLQGENADYRYKVSSFFVKLDNLEKTAKNNKALALLFDPKRVANLIYKISCKQNPKLRSRIGLDAHIYYYARKLLPDFVWQFILGKAYNSQPAT